MSTATAHRASLSEILADALSDAYWYRVERGAGCASCTRSATGACPDHEGDTALAREYETAAAVVKAATADRDVIALLRAAPLRLAGSGT